MYSAIYMAKLVLLKKFNFSRVIHTCYLGGDGLTPIDNNMSHSLLNRSSGFLDMLGDLYMGVQVICAALFISITVKIIFFTNSLFRNIKKI